MKKRLTLILTIIMILTSCGNEGGGTNSQTPFDITELDDTYEEVEKRACNSHSEEYQLSSCWYIVGTDMRHNNGDEPAYYTINDGLETKVWIKYGKWHREGDLPAVMVDFTDNGDVKQRSWYLNGKNHREGGLYSSIAYHTNRELYHKHWYLNNEYHREDGPAFNRYYDDGDVDLQRYYIEGQQYSEEEYNNYIDSI